MGQVSAIEKMGASNIGESIDLIQNVDYAFILGRISKTNYSPDESEIESIDKFLIFKLIACRSKSPKFTSFQHRFRDGNDMALIEDINSPYALSVRSIENLVKEAVKGTNQMTKGKRRVL